MTKIAFHNLGCKVNSYETEAMIQQMAASGYEIVPFEEKADIYVINTCTVTNIADRKSRQMIHRAKKMNPKALVVAAGCYAQADPEKVALEGVADLIVGNDQKGRLRELIEAHQSAVLDLKAPKEYEPLSISDSSEHTRAFMKIQDGCNQFCSYCLIPYVRGRIRSRRAEDVLEEAGRLADRGFCEIVLTGIHLSSYGKDWPEPGEEPLKDLILALAEIPGIQRIRLGSLEPRIITESFVKAIASCEKVCPHFHLSLQSGSATVLKRMNRHYTPEEYRERCHLLRQYYEHPAITTDVIVGFPGETEEEFEETRQFLEDIGFYEAHIFKYSRRKGTRADQMPDQIPETVKNERSRILLDLTARQSEDFRRYSLGKEVDFLPEQSILREGVSCLEGYTREYVKLWVPEEGHRAGVPFTTFVDEKSLGLRLF